MHDGAADTIHLLHVDDDVNFADLTATVLERERPQFSVETATSADEGVQRLETSSFDCVVSDYEMPGQHGIDFLEAVREAYPDLPFLLFTGKGSEEIASDAISVGVTDYLQKGGGTDQFTVLANRIENAVDHYRSQQAVERGRRRLRKIIDAVPHLLYVTDEHGRYVLANEALADFHETTVEQIEGAHVSDIMRPEYAKQYLADMETVLETGEPITVPETEMVASDGTAHVFEPQLLPYDFGESDTNTVLGLGIDVTERKAREQELNELVDRLQSLHDATRTLIRTDDREAVADLVTEAVSDILGHPSNVVRLREDDQLVPVAVTEHAHERLGDRPVYDIGEGLPGEVYEAGAPRIVDDLKAIDSGPQQGPLRAGLFLPIGDHGTLSIADEEPGAFDHLEQTLANILTGNAATVLDRLEGQRELERQNERLSEFGAALSHDLRNPLNVAQARLELAADDCDSLQLDAVARAHERMDTLVDDLLTVAHNRETSIDPEWLDLSRVVTDCRETVRSDGATVVVDLEDQIHADEGRLRQLLENLLRNAVEHGGADVTVEIGLLDNGFYVADDGPGILPEDRDDVFDAGFSMAENGTGFGLSIVQQVADAHGWSVTVTDSETGGARFEITSVEINR